MPDNWSVIDLWIDLSFRNLSYFPEKSRNPGRHPFSCFLTSSFLLPYLKHEKNPGNPPFFSTFRDNKKTQQILLLSLWSRATRIRTLRWRSQSPLYEGPISLDLRGFAKRTNKEFTYGITYHLIFHYYRAFSESIYYQYQEIFTILTEPLPLDLCCGNMHTKSSFP